MRIAPLIISLAIHTTVIGWAIFIHPTSTPPSVAIAPSTGGDAIPKGHIPFQFDRSTPNTPELEATLPEPPPQNRADAATEWESRPVRGPILPPIPAAETQPNNQPAPINASPEQPQNFFGPQLQSTFQSATPKSPPKPRNETTPDQIGEEGQGGDGLTLAIPTPGATNQPPTYPKEARQKNQQGTVILRIEVGSNGEVGAVETLTTSGYAILDQAASEAVRNWRFTPATRKGNPVASQLTLPIRFVLQT